VKLATEIVTASPGVNDLSVSAAQPSTLVEFFERVTQHHPKPDLLNYKKNGQWISLSAQTVLERVRNIAAGLYSLGVRHGDRVAILSESRCEWTLADAGCQFSGAIDVPIYPTLTPQQAGYILNDSGSSVVFIANQQKLTQLQEVLGTCATVRHVVVFDEADLAGEAITLSELERRGAALSAEQPNLLDQISRQTTSEELATIIYTSGTTGEPKGVMLTHANLISNIIDSAGRFAFNDDDVVLSVLPLSHVFERTAMYMYLYHGMKIFYGESLDKIGPNLREVQPTVFVGVPRIFEKIFARVKETAAEQGRLNLALLNWSVSVGTEVAKLMVQHQEIPSVLAQKYKLATIFVFKKWRDALGGRIRLLISGGAALPDDLAYSYIGAGLTIVQGYGLTETSPVITGGLPENNRIGTVGTAIPHVQVRIAADGEIEVRGPNVMRGYYNKPVETAAVFTEDGWFKTGDIGALDSDGFLRITDRKKELFKTSGGKYIAPQPIEQLIKGSRFVNQVVLIGNGRKFPAALIVPDWDNIDSYVQLKGIDCHSHAELCRHPRIIDLFERQIASLTPNLPQYERVKKVALIEHELTIEGGVLTPTLKVKRRVVDEKYRDLIDRLYREAEAERPTESSE